MDAQPGQWQGPAMARLLLALLLLGLARPAAGAGWTLASAGELAAAIDEAAAHGLDPARYGREALWTALAAGDSGAVDRLAPIAFRRLAADLMAGAAPAEARRAWHLPGPVAQPGLLDALMARALGGEGVQSVLRSLPPSHPQYRALQAALAGAEPGMRARIAVNLERWRWMPRELGDRHLFVNVPAFEARLVEDGREVALHRVIVGKVRTPTPQFSALATAVTLNPEWVVPASIQRESINRLLASNPAKARAQGYVRTATGVTQLPGPHNQLGQVKLRMPNPFSVYLHDTQAKALFARPVRAFSHGCIRTERPLDLAERLLAGTAWDRARIDAAVAAGRTVDAELGAPVPVHVVYFTAEVGPDGTLRLHGDLYGRDAPVAEALRPVAARASAPASAAVETECAPA